MTTHTPGPWMVGNHPGDNSGTDWREVLSTDGAFSPSYVCQALQADARLIAAAPDMLALLEKLIDIEGPQPGHSAWYAEVQAVIAKVRGA